MDRLIDGLFANLGEPDWASTFLSGVSAATGSHAAAVLEVDLSTGRQRLPAYVGQGADMAHAFERTHAVRNPWRPADESRGPAPGVIVVPDDVLPLSALRRTEFWADFLRPMDVDHACGLIGFRSSQKVLSITMLRSSRVGVYGAKEQAWLREISPHWVNACRLQTRLAEASRPRHPGPDPLDHSSTAAFFLDEHGRCTRWNAAGDALLQQGHLVRLRGGHLIAACPETGGAVIGAGLSALRNRAGRVSAHLAVHALPGGGVFGASQCVVFIDPVQSMNPSELRQALMMLHGLTTREAELAVRLADGTDLANAAATMNITAGAARTRLKIIYGKVGVRHQGALVSTVRSLRTVLQMDVR